MDTQRRGMNVYQLTDLQIMETALARFERECASNVITRKIEETHRKVKEDLAILHADKIASALR